MLMEVIQRASTQRTAFVERNRELKTMSKQRNTIICDAHDQLFPVSKKLRKFNLVLGGLLIALSMGNADAAGVRAKQVADLQVMTANNKLVGRAFQAGDSSASVVLTIGRQLFVLGVGEKSSSTHDGGVPTDTTTTTRTNINWDAAPVYYTADNCTGLAYIFLRGADTQTSPAPTGVYYFSFEAEQNTKMGVTPSALLPDHTLYLGDGSEAVVDVRSRLGVDTQSAGTAPLFNDGALGTCQKVMQGTDAARAVFTNAIPVVNLDRLYLPPFHYRLQRAAQ
jgi:hypothetical protein